MSSRPKWRANKRKNTAVKVYTIMNESKYMIIRNVPVYASESDLIQLIQHSGPLSFCKNVSEEYQHDQFTHVYLVKYHNILAARDMKRRCDDVSLVGNHLEISYAPEKENIDETKEKLKERKDHAKIAIAELESRKERAVRRGLATPL